MMIFPQYSPQCSQVKNFISLKNKMWSNTRANSRSLKTRSGTNIVEELIKEIWKKDIFGMWIHYF